MNNKRVFQIIFHNKVLLTAIILLFAVGVAIIIGMCIPEHKPTLQGQLETTDYRVATKVASRVVRLCVHEGDRVHKGDTLCYLSAPEVNAIEQSAKASRDVAIANKDLVNDGTRQEVINSAHDLWQQAQAKVAIAKTTYNRMEKLYQQGVIAEQKRDEAKADYDAAVAASQSKHEQYLTALDGARKEEKRASAAAVRNATAKIAEVKSFVDETVLTASQDGVVTEVFVEPGEIVGTGAPIMNVETDDAWFTFYFTEDKLVGLDYGTHVKIYRPSVGDTVEARITRINNAGDFASWKATRALDDIDLKVFEVRARAIKPLKNVHDGQSAILIPLQASPKERMFNHQN